MLALAALRAHDHGLGSGAWAGNRLVILGGYAVLAPFPALADVHTFVDSSAPILAALWEDARLRARLLAQRGIAPPQPAQLPRP